MRSRTFDMPTQRPSAWHPANAIIGLGAFVQIGKNGQID